MSSKQASTSQKCHSTNIVQLQYSGSSLLALPLELIFHITSFLPNPSLACFALTCKSVLAILGRRSLTSLDDELVSFLSLLDRDLLRWRHCPWCKTLHWVFGTETPILRRPASHNYFDGHASDMHTLGNQGKLMLLRCLSIQDAGRIEAMQDIGRDYLLQWSCVYLAMRRHHYGPGLGIPLQEFNHEQCLHTVWLGRKNSRHGSSTASSIFVRKYLSVARWMIFFRRNGVGGTKSVVNVNAHRSYLCIANP